MKTREQRRQRRPLGSIFVGQAPQKRSLAGAASCLLHNRVAPLARWAASIHAKYGEKNGKKLPKIKKNHHKSFKPHQMRLMRLLF